MEHHHGQNKLDTKNIKLAFFLNFTFTLIEIVGGILTNSVAILSDAAHDLGDTVTLGMAWYFQRISTKEGDSKYTYGYRRYSVLGAFITLFILFSGCIFILWESIPRLFQPEEVNPQGMVFLAILGIAVNLIAMLQLKKGSSLNEKVVSLHFLEDVLGWVAVLIGSVIMLFYDLPIIDPILSILIACYILLNMYRNMKLTLNILLQKTPLNIDLAAIEKKILEKDHVLKCTDIHVWTLDGNLNVLSANLYFPGELSIDQTFKIIESLHEELKYLNVDHATFESRTELE